MNQPLRHWRQNRRPRLEGSVYGLSGYAVHLIVHTYRCRPLFANSRGLASLAVQTLGESAEAQAVALLCYCLMPTHLYVVAVAEREGADVRRFITLFKTRMIWATKGQLSSHLWQRSFYDHVIQGRESVAEVCEYVLNNPIRAGLVLKWEEYPYSWVSEEV